ncbi:MAG: CoA transferase [Alphaproteobacteria bacterium]|nr:CoA transferase [Alphaproteobacteria bacterium]
MSGPLVGIRVLDLSRVLAGPWCGQLLADLGADVIKIERPGAGDDTRAWGPPFLKGPDGRPTTEAAYFQSTNRGKRSVTLDIATPEGQDVIRRLAATSDILIENYKVGGLARYGLGYDDLRKLNRGLIYCSITGFGQTGPNAERAGYDFMIQGLAGMMSVTGEADDKPGGGPQKIGVALSDILTGLYTAVAALAALRSRAETGEGQHVDMALFDVTTACMANQALNYLVTGVAPVRMGNAHPNIVPYQAFPTADHYLIIAIGNEGQFRRFCEIAGRPEVPADPRFKDNVSRVANRDALVAIITDFMRTRPRQVWIDLLDKAGVPCGPINDLAQVFADPQVAARGLRIELPHPTAGSVPGVANPIKLSGTPIAYERASPTLGQHTEEVLRGLAGLSPAEIAALRSKSIV